MAKRSKKILTVTHVPPFPIKSGIQARCVSLMRWLKKRGHQLTCLYLGREQLSREQRESFEQDFRFVSADDIELNTLERARCKLFRWISNLPGNSAHEKGDSYFWEREFDFIVRSVLKSCRPDILLLETLFTSRAARFVSKDCKVVIDTIDLYSERKNLADAKLEPSFYFSRDAEQRSLDVADILIAIRPDDANRLKSWFAKKEVLLVPHAHPIASMSDTSTEPVVLMVAYGSPANAQALEDFLDNAWPSIKEAVPEARFEVVGTVCNRFYGRLSKEVELLGFVENLVPIYGRASVVVNPVLYGSGIKIKSVEALCYGKALVSTPEGCAGIPLGSNSPLATCANWEEFSQAVIGILLNCSLRKSMERSAVDFAEKEFSEKNAYKDLERTLF